MPYMLKPRCPRCGDLVERLTPAGVCKHCVEEMKRELRP